MGLDKDLDKSFENFDLLHIHFPWLYVNMNMQREKHLEIHCTVMSVSCHLFFFLMKAVLGG